MFERLLAFLRQLPGGHATDTGLAQDDPRIAAAALMVHVIDADGVRSETERQKLRQLLSQAFGVSGGELDRLVAAGERAESEAVDVYSFTSVLNRHLDQEARIRFIALLWEAVYADGELHELEDHILWRVAELLHIEGRDRVAARQRAQGDLPREAGSSDDEQG